MSDTRRVESDTKHVIRDTRSEGAMSETAVAEARGYLEALMKAEHRGPADTWSAARDRTARKIGVKPSQTQRLWQRWEDMKDVSGGLYRALHHAYHAHCDRLDAIADADEARIQELRNEANGEERGAGALEQDHTVDPRAISPPAPPVSRAQEMTGGRQ